MKIYNFLLLVLAMIVWAGFGQAAQAVCPVCTVAVGAGLGLSRWLGIDDTVSGLWVGGLIVSFTMWTMNWLAKKTWRFRGDALIVTVGYYLLTLVPLYWGGIIGHPFNTLWGIDKLLVGVVVGSVAFWLGGSLYYALKQRNYGHAYFPFQKVVMPTLPLVILSIIFYFITNS